MCAVQQAVIQEVLGSSEEVQGEAGPLQMMMKDQYANYVVQKMLEVRNDSSRDCSLWSATLLCAVLACAFTYCNVCHVPCVLTDPGITSHGQWTDRE